MANLGPDQVPGRNPFFSSQSAAEKLVADHAQDPRLKGTVNAIMSVLNAGPDELAGSSGHGAIVHEFQEGENPPDYLNRLLYTIYQNLGIDPQRPTKVDFYTNGKLSGLLYRSSKDPNIWLERHVNPNNLSGPRIVESIELSRMNPMSRPTLAGHDN